MEKLLKIYLKILSPVHIGCDDVYEPTGFIIDESRRKLIAFDPMIFIKNLSDDERKEFSDICMQGDVASIPRLYDFVSRKKINGREVNIAGGLTENYRKVKALAKSKDEKIIRQELNQFAISRTVYNPHSEIPYVPGSSLKGAIRTAFLNRLAQEAKVTDWKGKAKDLEVKLLDGSFATDPFRLVKVSDFLPVGNVQTKIVYAVNKKKQKARFEARGPFQILEVLQSGSIFEGTITILEPHPKAGIKKPMTRDTLFKSLNEFYMAAFELENEIMQAIGADFTMYLNTKNKFKEDLDKKAFVIRLGRHSGAEAVTIKNNRIIKIMQKKGEKPKYSDESTTLWLASEKSKTTSNADLLPFGWAILSLEPLTAQTSVGKDTVIQAQPEVKSQKQEEKPIDKFINRLKLLKSSDAGPIGSLVDNAFKNLSSDDDKKTFAQAVKAHMGRAFNKSKAKQKVEPYLK